MHAQDLSTTLARWVRDPNRYIYSSSENLGMSLIGKCPLEIYNIMMADPLPSESMAWYHFIGYAIEAATLTIINTALHMAGRSVRVLPSRYIVSEFNRYFSGKTDGELSDGTLLEIKSVGWSKLERIRESGQPEPEHYSQVQMYLEHGHYDNAIIIYVARDIPYMQLIHWIADPSNFPAFVLLDVDHDETVQNRLNDKARMIFEALAYQNPPACECGRCKDVTK